ncbi:hypothetical protein AUC71_01765 [Methyloceanibacter marginalis]|uniref:Uncharacterized protein n=1 Tax=Methyloceanibacter marginalis TaxID=1774971 RepID=A0A1E3W9F1_9HYPH|nr:hypothetical protein [Methyloceanibacter marginalis]ODS02401.1 hypothetical protein AUC71_01765 [Methyloceanibacter marginalis]
MQLQAGDLVRAQAPAGVAVGAALGERRALGQRADGNEAALRQRLGLVDGDGEGDRLAGVGLEAIGRRERYIGDAARRSRLLLRRGHAGRDGRARHGQLLDQLLVLRCRVLPPQEEDKRQRHDGETDQSREQRAEGQAELFEARHTETRPRCHARRSDFQPRRDKILSGLAHAREQRSGRCPARPGARRLVEALNQRRNIWPPSL